MSAIGLVKNKYLTIAAKGLFSTYTPEQLSKTHQELEQFLVINSETLNINELFSLYELQFYLSILTNHDIEAKAYLDRILDQFNSSKSERIKLLKSIYLEAIGDIDALVKLLGQQQDELRLSRRLTTFSRHEDKSNGEYIESLNYYLNLQPSDLVTWCELAEEYAKIGHYDKAIFAYKEVLLQEQYAYNIFYKVGLYYYYSFLQVYNDKIDKKDKLLEWLELLTNSRNLFLRSVEIGGNYTKSWVGIYTVSTLDFIGKLSSNKNVNGLKQVKTFIQDSPKLSKLSQARITQIEQIKESDFRHYMEKLI
ncbi:hypothetical protein HYPBUDRAFT_109975 [Hyphopichia burtonii NRRL Y-1933]|uniref:ER membrane protein complex subunit 2 n=1 Tax=Hyphopichia burtonii NRRL Y-1933 TaxID=984485 RepID=A0A1E4RJC9_9ASCO|nr:hypothetical protein HYPBUDRAFT_109975 [Hyphopichia burtonii NRRL Y-1933]ODV67378.1 hypothetical protein HYPBUDRAFT_109975 [Hyphopichia burtonii NRRL Y-1933]